MDKLLRTQSDNQDQDAEELQVPARLATRPEFDESQPSSAAPSRSPFVFANLGAPRQERHRDEYVPNAVIPEAVQSPKAKAPHFQLVSQPMLAEATTGTYVKYGAIALFVGISIMSFLTQGVLALKDIVFAPNADTNESARLAQSASDNTLANIQKNKGQIHNSEDPSLNGQRALGSDDGDMAGSSTKQYSFFGNAKLQKPTAGAFLAADVLTGEIIYEYNPGLVAPIASVSKLMTATVAKENMDLEKVAIVSRDSYNTYGAEGKLVLGEKIKLYDLMYPLLIESSNDGAEVFSESYDKGHDAFMSLMNKKAAELGMTHTYYEDPSGLNPKNTSTVRDLMKLGRYIYQNHPDFFSMTRVRQYAILKHTWFNQNRFLNYDTFLGGKNGFIDEAKKTTVSIFNVALAKGGTRPVMIVLLKSDDREGDAVKIINYLKKDAQFQELPGTDN